MRFSLLAVLALGLGAGSLPAQEPGTPAPEIEARNWFNEPPGTSLEDLRGRVVFLEFWATW